MCKGITLNSWNYLALDVFKNVGEGDLEEKATAGTGTLALSGSFQISWASCKQDVTTLSISTETEYITLGSGAQDAMWLRKVLEFLQVPTVPRVWTTGEPRPHPTIQALKVTR